MAKLSINWKLATAISVALMTQTAYAADDLQVLKNQMAAMQKRIVELEAKQAAAPKASAKSSSKKGSDWNANSKALKLYGQANVSINSRSGSGVAASADGTSIESNASRIGVKGSVPSGLNNLNMIYQAELQYETTDQNDSTVKFREGYAGLQGKKFGKLRLGRLGTGYKSTLTDIDPWNDNTPQSRAGGIQGSSSLHSNYFNNAISYDSPKLGAGTKVNVWGSFNPDSTARLHNAGAIKKYTGGSAKGLGIKHKANNLTLAADVIDMDADTLSSGVKNGSGWQTAASYKAGPVKVAAFYEDISNLGLGKNKYANAIYSAGKTNYIASYGTHSDGTATASKSNKDFKTWSLGVQHKLNKKSKLFAAYTNQSNDTDNTDVKTLTAGLKIKFGY